MSKGTYKPHGIPKDYQIHGTHRNVDRFNNNYVSSTRMGVKDGYYTHVTYTQHEPLAPWQVPLQVIVCDETKQVCVAINRAGAVKLATKHGLIPTATKHHGINTLRHQKSEVTNHE